MADVESAASPPAVAAWPDAPGGQPDVRRPRIGDRLPPSAAAVSGVGRQIRQGNWAPFGHRTVGAVHRAYEVAPPRLHHGRSRIGEEGHV